MNEKESLKKLHREDEKKAIQERKNYRTSEAWKEDVAGVQPEEWQVAQLE
jgi:hypothetical protein